MDSLRLTNLPEFGPEDTVTSEVIEHPKCTTDRSISRQVALQVLYEVDSAHHSIENVISEQLQENPVTGKVARYLRRLVDGVARHRQTLDTVIQEYAPEWPLDQVAIVDRNILRIAIYELIFEPRVPVGVAIDEAVALADLFGGDGAPRFVNGVLGALADHLDTLRTAYAPSESEGENS